VVGFTIVSRGKVPGKTCEKGRKKIILADNEIIANDDIFT
jgi:hypothetical protein